MIYFFGSRIEASANYIQLELTNADRGVYEYLLECNPAVDDYLAKSFLLNQLFRASGGTVKVFDGGHRFWTPTKLPQDVRVLFSFGSRTLKVKNLLNLCDILQVTISKGKLRTGLEVEIKLIYKRVKTFNECRAILNIIMKRIMNELKLVKFGRSDFNPEMALKIPEYKLVECI